MGKAAIETRNRTITAAQRAKVVRQGLTDEPVPGVPGRWGDGDGTGDHGCAAASRAPAPILNRQPAGRTTTQARKTGRRRSHPTTAATGQPRNFRHGRRPRCSLVPLSDPVPGQVSTPPRLQQSLNRASPPLSLERKAGSRHALRHQSPCFTSPPDRGVVYAIHGRRRCINVDSEPVAQGVLDAAVLAVLADDDECGYDIDAPAAGRRVDRGQGTSGVRDAASVVPGGLAQNRTWYPATETRTASTYEYRPAPNELAEAGWCENISHRSRTSSRTGGGRHEAPRSWTCRWSHVDAVGRALTEVDPGAGDAQRPARARLGGGRRDPSLDLASRLGTPSAYARRVRRPPDWRAAMKSQMHRLRRLFGILSGSVNSVLREAGRLRTRVGRRSRLSPSPGSSQ